MRRLLLIVLTTVTACLLLSFTSEEQVDIVARSLAFIDVPYVYGGTDMNGVDCSGLVYLVYKNSINDIPRRAIDLYKYSLPLSGDDVLEPGDLVFFRTLGLAISHVGIFLGESRFIHAASGDHVSGVVISSLEEPYYQQHYVFARRVSARQENISSD